MLRVRAEVLSEQMARRTVEVPGYDAPQPFTVRIWCRTQPLRCLTPASPCCCAQSTEAFINETMRAVCGSMLLAQYKMCAPLSCPCHLRAALNDYVAYRARSFWGEQLWAEDMVPDYTQSKPVEPRLADLVRLVFALQRSSVALTKPFLQRSAAAWCAASAGR